MTTRANRPTTAPPCRIRVSSSSPKGDRQDVDEEEDADADDEADGAGAADQAEQPVDEQGGDPDVDQRGQVDLFEDRPEELRHRPAECSIAPRSRRVPSGRRARRRSPPAEGRRAAARRDRAQPLAGGGVVRGLGQARQQDELVGGGRPPAAVEVELGERQMQAGVGRARGEGLVAHVDRGVGLAGGPMTGRAAARAGGSLPGRRRRPRPRPRRRPRPDRTAAGGGSGRGLGLGLGRLATVGGRGGRFDGSTGSRLGRRPDRRGRRAPATGRRPRLDRSQSP